MLVITLQYILIAELVVLIFWTGYLFSLPGFTRSKEGPRRIISRGFVRFLDLQAVFVSSGFWLSVGCAWWYYASDWLLNLLPTILLGIATLPVVARFLQKVTLHAIILYASFIIPLIWVFMIIYAMEFSAVVYPFAIFLATALVLGVIQRVSPRSQQALNRVFLERRKVFEKCFTPPFFALLTVVALVELLFQLQGLSLLMPFA